MKQKNVRLPDHLADELRDHSKAARKSQGEVIEAALAMYFTAPSEDDRLDLIEQRLSRLEEVANL